jgi:Zn-dependent M28 family amino/carboxypeptidase
MLSGARPVTIAGEETHITSRYSPSMFDGSPNARAFEFVLEQVQGWYPEQQIEEMPYTVTSRETGETFTWKNLILTLPGTDYPEEVVILSAHLDSISRENPEEYAPGAEDNGSGSAALLEAARLMQGMRFERTVQIIWFTGEEQGLIGSTRFVRALKDPSVILGVINLDMFGYDSNDDRCFELHVGTLPQSDAVGQCFVESIEAYQTGLPRYDYLTHRATDRSDHGSFWARDIGAIEILENMMPPGPEDQDNPIACQNTDANPHYHTDQDTVEKINPETGIRIVRTALAALMGMAGVVQDG